MKALFKTKSGIGNMELRDIPIPQIRDNEVLLKISYCGICGTDLHIKNGNYKCKYPVVMGHEFSGCIDKIGKNVKKFKIGDAVCFLNGCRNCGGTPGIVSNGGFSEYIKVPSHCICKVPQGISQEEASQFEPLTVSLSMIRDAAKMEEGKRVVVSGRGAIGLFAIGFAKINKSSKIMSIGGNGTRSLMAESMGSNDTLFYNNDHIDYIKENKPHYWIETTGMSIAINTAIECMPRRGQIIVGGIGNDYNVDLNQVTKKGLIIKGQWGGNYRRIPEIAEYIQQGKMEIKKLLTVMPLSKWMSAFDKMEKREVIKVLLRP